MSARRKLLLVGFDAADGGLALRWMREGHMPNLARLAERGVAVPLRSAGEHMPESTWASLISGTSPGDHGIYSWRIVRPGTVGRGRMATGGWRRPFWWVLREYAPDPKPRVVVFDVPYSSGLRDDGITELSGWGLRVTRQGTSWPPGLFAELTGRHGAYPTWINRDYDRNPLSERRYLRILKKLTRRRTDIALDLLERAGWDCAIVNYTEPHFAGHAFFHHCSSAEPQRPRARYAAPAELLDVYAEADRNLGRLLETAGPDADVLVCSPIGLRPNETSKDLLGRIMIELGYQVPAAATTQSGRARRLAMRAATTVVPRVLRHRIRRFVPTGTAERIADDSWGEAIDWTRSRAVSEAEPGSAWLRLNLIGREPRGIVDPADRDALLDEIAAELALLTDPGTGDPVVAEVIPVADVAPGELVHQMPDLLVRWTPGRRIRRVSHPRAGIIDDGGGPYARTEHSGSGFLVAAGPGIAATGVTVETSVREIDVAPTVLHLFGCPVPEGMQGVVLEWLLDGETELAPKAPIELAVEPTF